MARGIVEGRPDEKERFDTTLSRRALPAVLLIGTRYRKETAGKARRLNVEGCGYGAVAGACCTNSRSMPLRGSLVMFRPPLDSKVRV